MSTFSHDPSHHDPHQRPLAAQLYPLLSAFLGAPLLMLVPLGVTLGMPADNAPVEAVVIVALWLSAAFLVTETVGHRAPPLSGDLDAATIARIGRERFRQRLIIRLAVSESPIIGAIPIAFAVQNLTVYVFALLLGWPMLAYVAWPGQRTVAKMRQYLEAEGTASHLDQIVLGRGSPDSAP